MINQSEFLDILVNLENNDTELIAVSKRQKIEKIELAYSWGQRHFAENQIQELVKKRSSLPDDIKWHMIGHLQSNKLKYISSFIDLIQSVDSLKLLQKINLEGIKHKRTINILLQLKIAKEDTKYGLMQNEVDEILKLYCQNKFSHIQIQGLMGMASNVKDNEIIRMEFEAINVIFEEVSKKFQLNPDIFKIRSYGMSSDYELALQTGSNMVRLGSSIFGDRN